MIERDGKLSPMEIKSGQTIASDYFDSLNKWKILSGIKGQTAWLVYGGEAELMHESVTVVPWRKVSTLADRI